MIAACLSVASCAMLAALPDLMGVYVFCLVVGGGLLVVSTFFGGDHDVDSGLDLDGGVDLDAGADLDGGADVDVQAEHGGELTAGHAGALGLSNWLSVRFAVYFAAMFGLTGTVLTYFADVSPMWTLGIALLAGTCMGQLVHQTIRALQRGSVSSESRVEDIIDQPGRVTVAVRPPARGEVGVHVGDREIFLPAVAQRSDDVFEVGSQVIVAGYISGLAEVVSRQEYEFTHNA
jgi:hypothetical protein